MISHERQGRRMDPHHTADRVIGRRRRSQSRRVLQGRGADLGSKQPGCDDLASGGQDIAIDDLCSEGNAWVWAAFILIFFFLQGKTHTVRFIYLFIYFEIEGERKIVIKNVRVGIFYFLFLFLIRDIVGLYIGEV